MSDFYDLYQIIFTYCGQLLSCNLTCFLFYLNTESRNHTVFTIIFPPLYSGKCLLILHLINSSNTYSLDYNILFLFNLENMSLYKELLLHLQSNQIK